MAHMFYVTLGNTGLYNTSGNPQASYGLTNTGPFSNIQSNQYWSATAYAPFPNSNAWYFNNNDGGQNDFNQSVGLYAWAVHSGDVGTPVPVPEPASVWLFGSGVLMLLGMSGKRRRC
jgi:hypothetical protein